MGKIKEIKKAKGERNKNKGHAMKEKKETRNSSYQWAQILARL
jgi:hypothetical protein